MSRRSFKFQERIAKNKANGILDIPNFAVLRHCSPQDMIKNFIKTYDAKPEGVCLPVIAPDGLLFEIQGFGELYSKYRKVSDHLQDFQDVVHSFSEQGLDIYLCLTPKINFFSSDSLHVVDIIGNGTPQLCVNNHLAQELLSAILGTAIDLTLETTSKLRGKLKGICLNIVDILGMGGEGNRVHLTCFCPECESFIESYHPGLLKYFKTFPNPWNLLLKSSGTGMSYIDDITSTTKPEDIVGLCRQRGYEKVFTDYSTSNLTQHSEILLKYLKTRHEQVLLSVEAIFSEALNGINDKPIKILLLEGANYGWTSGLFVDSINSNSGKTIIDEIWINPYSNQILENPVYYKSYMWRRSRYFIDNFFDICASVSNPIIMSTTGLGRLPKSEVKSTLIRRLKQATGTSMEGTSLSTLPSLHSDEKQSYRTGFVGVGFNHDIGSKIIEELQLSEGLYQESDQSKSFPNIELLKMLSDSLDLDIENNED